jgi:hypothetical protein
VGRYRECCHAVDQLPLCWAQIEVETAVGFGKAGQAI